MKRKLFRYGLLFAIGSAITALLLTLKCPLWLVAAFTVVRGVVFLRAFL